MLSQTIKNSRSLTIKVRNKNFRPKSFIQSSSKYRQFRCLKHFPQTWLLGSPSTSFSLISQHPTVTSSSNQPNLPISRHYHWAVQILSSSISDGFKFLHYPQQFFQIFQDRTLNPSIISVRPQVFKSFCHWFSLLLFTIIFFTAVSISALSVLSFSLCLELYLKFALLCFCLKQLQS